MDKDRKEKDIKRKFIRRYLIILCAIIVFLIGSTYVCYIVTHKDKNRAPKLDVTYKTTDIYNKAIVESFSNTKDSGRISFSFSDQDINNLLNVAKEKVLDNKEEALYYELNNNNPTFYIDLKPRLGVKTRVKLSLELVTLTESHTFEYKVSSVTMGKIPYTNKGRYLTESFFESISKYTSLPISYNKSSNKVNISPLDIFDSFYPKDGLFKVINDLVNKDKSIISLSSSNPFSFDIDLSLFRNNNHISSVTKLGDDINLYNKAKGLLTEEYLDNIYTHDEGATLTKISLEEYNSLISSSLVDKESSRLTSNLTNEVVIISIKELYSSFSVDKITYTFVLSINGYEIDINIDTLSVESLEKFELLETINNKVMISSYEFSMSSDIGVIFMTYLDNALSSLDELSNSVIKYEESSRLLTISFKDIINNLDYNVSPFIFTLAMDNINLDGFNLIITK